MRLLLSRLATSLSSILLISSSTHSFSPNIHSSRRSSFLQPILQSSSPTPSPPSFQDDDIAASTAAATITKKDQVLDEANSALSSVGWSAPIDDGEMTSDDPFVKRIDSQIRTDMGVGLDELLNPAKVVNLERDLYNLRTELAGLTGVVLENESGVLDMSTEECDGGGGGDAADVVRGKIEKKERDLLVERRAVFRGWLKNVFLGQAVLSFVVSWFMVTDPSVLFGGFGWFDQYALDMPIRVLGFWWWWLFIVPSLRSRRPSGMEKKALDIAFLATPAISLIAPVATKDTAVIWFANLVVVLGSYAFAYATDGSEDDGEDEDKKQPEWLKFVYKSLDFGTGRERGARK